MPSKQHAEIQGNWMERLAFQSNIARTPKCDNCVLVSARHTLWHVGKEKSGAVILSMNFLQFSHHITNSWNSPYLTLRQNHNSSLWLTQRKCSINYRIKRNRGKRRGRKEEREGREEGRRKTTSLSEQVDLMSFQGWRLYHWTAHTLNDICEFSPGVDVCNSLFLLLIEFGLQIKQRVPIRI